MANSKSKISPDEAYRLFKEQYAEDITREQFDRLLEEYLDAPAETTQERVEKVYSRRKVESRKPKLSGKRLRRHSKPRGTSILDLGDTPPWSGPVDSEFNERTGTWCGVHVEGDTALLGRMLTVIRRHKGKRITAQVVARNLGVKMDTAYRLMRALKRLRDLAARSKQHVFDSVLVFGPDHPEPQLAFPERASDPTKVIDPDAVKFFMTEQPPHVPLEKSVAGRTLLRQAAKLAGVSKDHPEYDDRLMDAVLRIEKGLRDAGPYFVCDHCGYPLLDGKRRSKTAPHHWCSESCRSARRRWEKKTAEDSPGKPPHTGT